MSKQHNCMHCRNYHRHWGSVSAPEGFELLPMGDDTCLGNYYGMCSAGHNDIMKDWWMKNKDVRTDEASDTPCYEGTEMSNALDNIINSIDNLLSK